MIHRQRLVRGMATIVLALVGVALNTTGCAKREKYAFAQQPLYATAISAQREIDELAAFFGHWYRGEIPNTDAAFDRFDRVMHEDFTIVTPEGEILKRSQIASDIRRRHGLSILYRII